MRAGTIVRSRRSHTGICQWTNPCMTTWPAMVPTVEEERPEAKSEIAKIQLAAHPRSGVRVL